MSAIQLPCYIYSGLDSVGRIFDSGCKKILVAADCEKSFGSDVLNTMLKKAHNHGVSVDLVTEDAPDLILNRIQEKLMIGLPELFVAIGAGKVADCVAVASALTEIPYFCVPRCAPTELTNVDSSEAMLTRKLPFGYIFDPDMIVNTNSLKIAYEGLGMLALCVESFFRATDRYIRSLSKMALEQIIADLFSAYKGEISARENLLEAMGWAQIVYANSYSFLWESPCYRLCEFFKTFGVDSLSVLAVSVVQLTEGIINNDSFSLNKITDGAEITAKIRKLRAKMSVPSCIKNLNVDESRFKNVSADLNDEDRHLFERCFYSDFFDKNENTAFVKC